MASPTFYAVGTVTVANGSTAVTGVGTSWADRVYPGDLFADPAQPLVPPQRIASVTDDTHLVLWAGWPGTAIAAGAYEVRITPDSARVQENTRRVLEALASAVNVGFAPPVGMTADDVQAALEELAGRDPLPTAGATGQHLAKQSGTDGDAEWTYDLFTPTINEGAVRWDEHTRELIGLSVAITNGNAQYLTKQNAGRPGQVGGNEGLFQFSADASCAYMGFYKSRSATKGDITGAVTENTDLGEINFEGSDGANLIKAGFFTAVVDGTVTSGIVPMRYSWGNMNAAGAMPENMRLDKDGNLIIGGLTAGSAYAATAKLDVNGQAKVDGLRVSGSTIPEAGIFKKGSAQVNLAANGLEVLQLFGAAAAVNRLSINNAATGGAVSAGAAQGTDTNIGLFYLAKGAADLQFETGGTSFLEQFRVSHTASAVNRVQVTGAATGAGPTVSAQGSDTNLPLILTPKGTGDLRSAAVNSNTTASAANVNVDGSGNLRRSTSSLRFKTDVEPLDSEHADAVLTLQPIWYRSLSPADNPNWSWYGLGAEDVAALDPRLVNWTYEEDQFDEVVTVVPESRQAINVLRDGAQPDDDGAYQDSDWQTVERVFAEERLIDRVLKPNAQLTPGGVMYDRLVVMLLDVVRRQGERIASLELSTRQ